jgi:hypothetical protein
MPYKPTPKEAVERVEEIKRILGPYKSAGLEFRYVEQVNRTWFWSFVTKTFYVIKDNKLVTLFGLAPLMVTEYAPIMIAGEIAKALVSFDPETKPDFEEPQ